MTEANAPGYLLLGGVQYVTTAEAAEHFAPDVTLDMVKDWVKRGILKPAGRYPGRSSVYRLIDVANAERRTRIERRGRTRRAGELQKIGTVGHNLSPEVLADSAQKPSRPSRCTVVRDNGRDCKQLAVPDAPFRICKVHLQQAYLHWRDYQEEIYRANPDIPFDRSLERLPALSEEPTFVYYIRFGDRIKIGYSANIRSRLSNLPCDELLALEPGPVQLERMRHKQFKAHRLAVNSEWFYENPDLLSHIQMLVDHYGTAQAQLDEIERQRWQHPSMAEGPDGLRRIITKHPGVPEDSQTHINQ